MPYVALKTFDAPGGAKRRPGDVVPEATTWKNPQPWVNSGHVRFVPDGEIKGGRWSNYEAYAGAGAVRHGPAPVVPGVDKAPALVPDAPVVAKAKSPEPMEVESTPSPKRGSKKSKSSRDED